MLGVLLILRSVYLEHPHERDLSKQPVDILVTLPHSHCNMYVVDTFLPFGIAPITVSLPLTCPTLYFAGLPNFTSHISITKAGLKFGFSPGYP